MPHAAKDRMNWVPAIALFGTEHLWLLSFPGMAAGLAMIFRGYRESRHACVPSRPDLKVITSLPSATASKPQPEIIHLSSAREPLRSTEMTEQGRIAAAMTKAGIGNPAAWSRMAAEKTTRGNGGGVSGGAAAGLATALEQDEPKSQTLLTKVNCHEFEAPASLWGGAALLVLSLYIALAHFGWL
jgi:hypothetical protein